MVTVVAASADDDAQPMDTTGLSSPPPAPLSKTTNVTIAPDVASLDDTATGEEIIPDHYYGGGKVPVFKPVSAIEMWRAIYMLRWSLGISSPWSGIRKADACPGDDDRQWPNSGASRTMSTRSINTA